MNAIPLTPLRDFSDRLSPMLVKELRHGLRTKTFIALLTVFQVLMMMVVSAGIAGGDNQAVSNFFWSINLFALLLALPVRGFGLLAGEAKEGTMDMLTLTSISSFRIVYGKWLAMFSQSLLLACSLLPYMVARYYIGGVEIVQESLALTVAVLGSAVASAAFIAFSSQRSIVLRLFLSAGILFALMPLTSFVFILINDSGRMLREMVSLDWVEQTEIVVGIIVVTIYLVYALLALGASRIAPLSENHSTIKRIVHLVMLTLLSAAGGILLMEPNPELFLWAYIPSIVMTCIVGLDLLTEEMPQFPSVVQGAVDKGIFATLLGRLFYPGWCSGAFLYTLFVVMNLSLPLGYSLVQSREQEMIFYMACVSIAPVIPVCIRLNKTNRFANWVVVQVGLMIAGILLVMFCSISGAREGGYLGVITPITGIFGSGVYYSEAKSVIITAAGFALCWLGASLVYAATESRIYAYLENEARGNTQKPI
jgi:hypothetical protein